MVRETCVTSKVPIAFRTGDSKARECTRRASHTVATRLVAGVRDVTCTCLVTPFTHELSSHAACKICDYVMSFHVVIQYIKSFSGLPALQK